MNPASLDQLKDIHLPDSAHWWPLAAGWWILIAISLVFIVAVVWLRYKRNQKRGAIRQVQNELTLFKDRTASVELLSEANHLFRRALLTYLPHNQIANQNLLSITEQLQANSDSQIASTSRALLKDAQYRPRLTITTQQWHQYIDDMSALVGTLDRYRSLRAEIKDV